MLLVGITNCAGFAFTILGLVIVPANFGFFGDSGGPDTCELTPMIALTIPFAFICLGCVCCLTVPCLVTALMCCGVIKLDDFVSSEESTATSDEDADQMEAGDNEDST
mmetsp:Transcript_469/g.1039  ORF Transcript_469/g.1039 Transcript_469/m.1039 type:complete len:108 (+) Transcript_469:347-670(+)